MHLPATAQALIAAQEDCGRQAPPPWQRPDGDPLLAAFFVVFGRGGSGDGQAGDRGWAAAVCCRNRETGIQTVVDGEAGAAYQPGLLLLREGPLLAGALDRLRTRPDVLLFNATGRDHPRRCGVAVHLGALAGLPSIGVTDRPLAARAAEPGPARGDCTPLRLAGEQVGWALRSLRGTRPLYVHAGWRMTPDMALECILAWTGRARTPEPLRAARRLAREARAGRRGVSG